MKINITAFTAQGCDLGKELELILWRQGIECKFSSGRVRGSLQEWTKEAFETCDALIYIGATGIAVRGVAPFVQSKTSDPAVLVIDDRGKFVIPLLSGHIGGANKLALAISKLIHAQPIITTATDGNNVFAVDSWTMSQGLRIANPEEIVTISSALLDKKTVYVESEFPIDGNIPQGLVLGKGTPSLWISYTQAVIQHTLQIVPPVLTLGIGCKKNTPVEKIQSLFMDVVRETRIHPLAIEKVTSIDLKKEEAGILEFSEMIEIPFLTYTAEELSKVEGIFTGSSFVKSITGVDNVCERSALVEEGHKLILRKKSKDGVTMALSIRQPKIIWE